MATSPNLPTAPRLPTIGIPALPNVTRILSRFQRPQIESFIAVALDLLDTLDGDPEVEPATWPEALDARRGDTGLPDDSEAAGDEADTSWPEWQSRGRHKLAGGMAEMAGDAGHEDDEDGDPDTSIEDSLEGFDPEDDMAVDDQGCDDDPDVECEQLLQDVPMLPVLSANHNIFTDQRVPPGLSNLQSSYRTNGGEVRSADSGEVHRSHGFTKLPGEPV